MTEAGRSVEGMHLDAPSTVHSVRNGFSEHC